MFEGAWHFPGKQAAEWRTWQRGRAELCEALLEKHLPHLAAYGRRSLRSRRGCVEIGKSQNRRFRLDFHLQALRLSFLGGNSKPKSFCSGQVSFNSCLTK